MFKKAGLLMASLLWLVPLGFSQYNRIDVAVNGGALFTHQVDGNNVTQSATKSGEGFVTARFRFSAHHSIEVNYGRSSNSQLYSVPPFDYRMQAHISEYSGAYVFSPIETRNFEPFLLAGIGGLKFNPYDEYIQTVKVPVAGTSTTQVAVLYGGGFDYRIFSKIPFVSRAPFSSRFALRLQYRGFLYKAPSFHQDTLFTGGRSHIAEPSIGLVFKF